MHIIKTSRLTTSYGKNRGIVDVDLQVEPGEIFGFIGPNGAGKTTTIRTLLNFIFPDSGKAEIFGLDCIRKTSEIKRQIGYIPGEVNYYDNMRVRDLLAYAASFHRNGAAQQINPLSERFGLNLDQRIDTLSFGNKKKVAIVQALLHRPRLLILDEPTSGLDPLMQKRFFELLQEENQAGTTIFFSSHILSEVERLCSRVAIIKDGRILKIETIDRLKDKTYKKVNLHLNQPIENEANPLSRMPGVSQIRQENQSLRFFYQGDINLLLKELTQIPLENIWLEEPSLEEIFLHEYDEGGDPA
jgi:ABC-2 type transport system ATP-binding protein